MHPASHHYLGESGRRYHQGKRGVPPAAEPWVARARARLFAPWVRQDHAVFEFGVGLGWNLSALDCRRRIGTDVAESLADEVRSRGIEWLADARALEEASVDVIICHHTLEHVPDPAATLEFLATRLKPQGRLWLAVPWERERRYRRYDPGEPNHHLFTWNCQTLGNLAADCGFTVLQARAARYGYDRFAAFWAWKLRAGERGFRFGRALLQAIRPCWEIRLIAMPATPVDQARPD